MRAAALAIVFLLAAPARGDELPAGDGQEEVAALCTGCHDSSVIRRSRLDRARWDGLMDWMTERHGMPPLDGDLRVTVVDYLARHFPPGRAEARGRNPFLP